MSGLHPWEINTATLRVQIPYTLETYGTVIPYTLGSRPSVSILLGRERFEIREGPEEVGHEKNDIMYSAVESTVNLD